MNKRYEMRFTGSGGQGVILMSVVMAEAATVAGKHTIQCQSYGPEARGGLCKAECMISKNEIYYSRIKKPNFLIALTQGSLEKYAPDVTDDALIMIDSSLTPPDYIDPDRLISIPIIETAKNVVGKEMTANMVALGAINAALGLFTYDEMKEAVKRHIPQGTVKMNKAAFEAGIAMITPEMAEKFKTDIIV